MNKEQLAKMKLQIKNRENAVDRVLTEYCSQDGCPFWHSLSRHA